jgi:hypothetical protein
MVRLVQLQHPEQGRQAAVVGEQWLHPLNRYRTAYDCALAAARSDTPLAEFVVDFITDVSLDYDAIYAGASDWHLLPAFDHPAEPARCLVSGTGLTHRKSADNRNAMHAGAAATVTDSMRIYQWGVEGGRPEPGEIGAQPEWFYKGCGTILRAHGEPLDVPAYAEDGGEEPEIAGIYIVDDSGTPWRVGFALGNEFSDHRMESRNYLYLAPSKLRNCALGPELLVGAPFDDVHGTVTVERGGQALWHQEVASGEANMVHTLANLEHHHFKYAAHCRPGDAHVHFFGTGGFSYGAGVQLADGDMMIVAYEGCGRPLCNPIRIDSSAAVLAEVKML